MSDQPPPEFSRPQQQEPQRSSCLSIVLASVLFIVVLSLLLSLPVLGPWGLAVIIGVLILTPVIGLHYLIWGWWLGPALRAEHEERKLSETDAEK